MGKGKVNCGGGTGVAGRGRGADRRRHRRTGREAGRSTGRDADRGGTGVDLGEHMTRCRE